MSTAITKPQPVNEVFQNLISTPAVKSRIDELLGKNAPQFVSSILSIINADQNLVQAFYDSPISVLSVAMKAAIYNLPLGQELGFAYIVPFKNSKSGKSEAQFIIGYKGHIQLALRTRKFTRLGAVDVRQGELKSYDHLYGDTQIEWIQDPVERAKSPVIGYLAKKKDGFEKQLFKTIAEINQNE